MAQGRKRKPRHLQFRQKIVEGFRVKVCQLEKFHDVHPSFPRFTFGEKRMRQPQFLRNFALRQFGFLACFDQAPKETVINRLMRSRPRLA